LLAALMAVHLQALAAEPANQDTQHDLRRFTPMEFLAYLKTDTRPMRVYTVGEPVRCWVTASDIPALMARLDSNEKSMSVVLGAASNIRKASREADEAAYLIEGFRHGKYPPTLSSVAVTGKEVSELRAWWADYEAGAVTQGGGDDSCAGR
jgi:hypothetical protein